MIFNDAANQFKDVMIEVLYVDSDHLHLYLNSSPDYSVDEIVNKTLTFVESIINKNYPDILDNETKVFESSYFAETIG